MREVLLAPKSTSMTAEAARALARPYATNPTGDLTPFRLGLAFGHARTLRWALEEYCQCNRLDPPRKRLREVHGLLDLGVAAEALGARVVLFAETRGTARLYWPSSEASRPPVSSARWRARATCSCSSSPARRHGVTTAVGRGYVSAWPARRPPSSTRRRPDPSAADPALGGGPSSRGPRRRRPRKRTTESRRRTRMTMSAAASSTAATPQEPPPPPPQQPPPPRPRQRPPPLQPQPLRPPRGRSSTAAPAAAATAAAPAAANASSAVPMRRLGRKARE